MNKSILINVNINITKDIKMQKVKPAKSLLSNQMPYRSGPIRFLVLFLLSMVVFANMYAFNNPQALQDSLMKELSISQTQFNMLYTVIALPNIVFPFFIGIIIDFIGVRVAFVTLTFSVIVFQTVVAFGGVTQNFHTMLIGRMLFGIAVESLCVAQTCFVSYWFLGKELAFAIGVATTLPELGNALNSIITPIVYEKTQKLGPPLFISVGICCFSFICACIAAYIDYKADQQDKQHNLREVTDSELDFAQAEPEHIKWSDLKQLRGTFWLIIVLCMFAIAQYIPFLDNVNKLLQVRFCFSQVSAGKNIMVTYLVTSLLGFPLGIIVDKIGFKRYLTMFGMLLFMTAHVIIYAYPQCDELAPEPAWSGASWGLFLLGFAYCFYANCIIPSIPIVVSKRITGTAFGIMLVLENFAMAVCPMISGQIVEHSATKQIGYRNSSLFFMILGVIGLLISFGLFFLSDKTKKILDGTSQQKKMTAIQLEKYYSDGEYHRGTMLTEDSGLNMRLIKSYDHLEFSDHRRLKLEMQPKYDMPL